MNEIEKILWDEVRDSLELDRLMEQRKPIEAIPKPSIKENIFQSVIEQKEKWILSELQRYRKTQTLAGLKDSGRSISDETPEGQQVILDFVEKHFLNGQVKMTSLKEELASLKEWGKYLDEESNQDAQKTWLSRCNEIDRLIAEVKARIPERFYPNMINTSVISDPPVIRFPASRIGQIGERYSDKWLTQKLNSKKEICFEPFSEYLIELKKWGKEIALPLLAKEREAERLLNAPKAPLPPPVEPQPKAPSWGQMVEDDPTTTLQGRIKNRIYGGKS